MYTCVVLDSDMPAVMYFRAFLEKYQESNKICLTSCSTGNTRLFNIFNEYEVQVNADKLFINMYWKVDFARRAFLTI